MASLLGTTAPTVSPDNKWIAFVRNQDLWLYETATQQVKRATSIGRPYTKVFASIEVLIVAWSRDGGRILIRTEPGETECVDCEDRGDWKARKADYGYFLYRLRQRQVERVKVPELEIAGWLDDEWLLGTTTTTPNSMVITKLDGTARPLAVDLGSQSVSQLRLTSNGESAYAALHRDDSSSQIVRISPKTGEVTPISEKGSFAEFQWPVPSPGDRQVAWMQQVGSVPSPSSRLLVNGKPIFSCAMAGLSFEWIDETRLVTNCGENVVILDSSNGKQVATLALKDPLGSVH